jgi:hypothetical protein
MADQYKVLKRFSFAGSSDGEGAVVWSPGEIVGAEKVPEARGFKFPAGETPLGFLCRKGAIEKIEKAPAPPPAVEEKVSDLEDDGKPSERNWRGFSRPKK